MAGQNPTSEYSLLSNVGANATTYKAQIDANSVVAARMVDNFAPHQASTPNMTITLDAGHVFTDTALTEVAQQSTTATTAPSGSNKRIDRAVINNTTGAVTLVVGTPTAGTPAPPAIPSGYSPVAQIGTTTNPLLSTTTAITDSMITDERDLSKVGQIAFANLPTISGNAVYGSFGGAGQTLALGSGFVISSGNLAPPQYMTTTYLTQAVNGVSGTYYPPANCRKIKVRMVGGGGGGGASTTNSGTAGVLTSFDGVAAAGGGLGHFGGTANTASNGGTGGTNGTLSYVFRIPGGSGAAVLNVGGAGGGTPFGPGAPFVSPTVGPAALPATGGGGCGGYNGGTGTGGGTGGGGGEYAEFEIVSPSSGGYSWTIGSGGTGGAAGSVAGTNGGSGAIIIEEYY